MWDEHTWLANGPIPARDIHRGRQGRNTIYFPSLKNSAQLVCESALEASYCIWLEWDLDVKAYYPQPYTFMWTCSEGAMHYTPDFYVVHHNSLNHFTEVKPDFNRTPRKYRRTLDAFTAYGDGLGTRLKLADCKSIRQPVRLNNLKLLYSRLYRIAPLEYDYLRDFLTRCNDTMTLHECLQTRNPPSLRALSLAIFNGELVANLNAPLTMESILTKRRRP